MFCGYLIVFFLNFNFKNIMIDLIRIIEIIFVYYFCLFCFVIILKFINIESGLGDFEFN